MERWTKKEDKVIIKVLQRVARKSDAVRILEDKFPERTTSALTQRVFRLAKTTPVEQKKKPLKVEVRKNVVLIHL
jgi:hypothetical protein